MIFVPIGRSAAEQLRTEPAGRYAGPAFAATPGLMRAHGFDASADEEANLSAQNYAMVAGLVDDLADDGGRLVLAAEVADRRVQQDDSGAEELGEVHVSDLAWSEVQAVFADGPHPSPETMAAVRRAVQAIGDRIGQRSADLRRAVDLPEVTAVIEEHDLLWHVPNEPW